MALIRPTTQPAFYVIPSHEIDGVTNFGQATGVNNTLTVIYAEGETEFLNSTKTTSYKPLPSFGVFMNAGEIYGYLSGCVIVRQSHCRTEHNPPDVPALFAVYRANTTDMDWIAGEPVLVGSRRKYNTKLYECLQAHQTQIDWTPPAVPALWKEVITTPPTGAWSYPTAYKINDRVIYQTKTYRCIQAHTSNVSWTPTATINVLWVLVT